MTRYTVTWWDEARDELARLWLRSDDKSRITLATNAIDRELSVDPMQKGTSGYEGLMQIVVEPLHVQFTVKENDRLVEILSVRRTHVE